MRNMVNKHRDTASTKVTVFLHCTPRTWSRKRKKWYHTCGTDPSLSYTKCSHRSIDLYYSCIYTFSPALGIICLYQKFALIKINLQLVSSVYAVLYNNLLDFLLIASKISFSQSEDDAKWKGTIWQLTALPPSGSPTRSIPAQQSIETHGRPEAQL